MVRGENSVQRKDNLSDCASVWPLFGIFFQKNRAFFRKKVARKEKVMYLCGEIVG